MLYIYVRIKKGEDWEIPPQKKETLPLFALYA